MNEAQRNEESDLTELLCCPFCGHKCDLKEPDTLYPTGIYWKESSDYGRAYFGRTHKLFDPFMVQQCWQINCVTISGGCGANIIGDSRDETIAAWQRRVT